MSFLPRGTGSLKGSVSESTKLTGLRGKERVLDQALSAFKVVLHSKITSWKGW
jgi:hypothetical protein